MELFDRIIDKNLLTRRIYVVANNVINEASLEKEDTCEQINLFTCFCKSKSLDKEFKKKKHNKND